jgi:hypothetical protein
MLKGYFNDKMKQKLKNVELRKSDFYILDKFLYKGSHILIL